MFGTLLESKSRRRRRTRVAAVSIAAHAVAITLASAATRREPVPPPEPPRDTALIYVAPPVEHTIRRNAGHGTPVPGHRITAPTSTPTGLPSIGPMQVDVADPVIGTSTGESLTAPTPEMGAGTASGSVPDGGVYRIVERAAAALPGAPRARYPESLRQAAVEGQAVLRFVVDSAGRVERGSVVTVSATHGLFAAAAREALAGTRFAPAEVGGRRVRQLVEQAYAFTLDR